MSRIDIRLSLPMMGYLTRNNQDTCAEAREELLHNGGKKMECALEVLESVAVLIFLDKNKEPVLQRQRSTIF